METTYRRFTGLNLALLVMILPAFYVITISLLKYSLGFDGLFDASQPFLESVGFHEPPGWNINMVILAGPIVAALFSVLEVLSIEWQFSEEQFKFYVSIRRRWFPIAIAIISGLLLTVICLYLFNDNYEPI